MDAHTPNSVIVTVSEDFDILYSSTDQFTDFFEELPDFFAENYEVFGFDEPVLASDVQVIYAVHQPRSIVADISIHFVVARDEPNHLVSHDYKDLVLNHMAQHSIPTDSVQLSSSVIATHGVWIRSGESIAW